MSILGQLPTIMLINAITIDAENNSHVPLITRKPVLDD